MLASINLLSIHELNPAGVREACASQSEHCTGAICSRRCNHNTRDIDGSLSRFICVDITIFVDRYLCKYLGSNMNINI